MAEMLGDVGYSTAYLGKWHLGTEPQSQPQNQGYDSYFGILNSTDEAVFAVSMAQARYEPTDAERAYDRLGEIPPAATEAIRAMFAAVETLAKLIARPTPHSQSPRPPGATSDE